MSGLWNGHKLPALDYQSSDQFARQVEMRLLLTISAQSLSELERAAIHGSMEEIRQEDTGRTHGVSTSDVNKARQRAVQKMRRRLRAYRIRRISDVL